MMFADIDIDVADRDLALAEIRHVPALMAGKERKPHVTGVYLQDVPSDPLDGICAYSPEDAASLGYFKIDVLNRRLYAEVRDEAHLLELMEREPEWDLLLEPDVVDALDHVRGRVKELRQIVPVTVYDLAICLAIIRPGKSHLIGQPRHVIEAEIWTPTPGVYSYKKPHAIAYAVSVVVQLNLFVEQAAA